MPVMLRFPRHEVDRDRANLRTIGHDLHVLRLGMSASRLKAMVHRHVEAGDVAFMAGVHARLHLGIDLMHHSSPAEPPPI
jgi:hypothetical protein